MGGCVKPSERTTIGVKATGMHAAAAEIHPGHAAAVKPAAGVGNLRSKKRGG
jgi:hypothetical protein